MRIRILIADDHGVLRAGLRALLNAEPDLEVVGEAADGYEALHLAAERRPDVLLLDLSMPGPGGFSITQQLRQMVPETRVLILTLHEDVDLLREVMRAGAAGYIVKRAADVELIDAIRAVSRGDLYIHPAMTRALILQETALLARHDKTVGESLTPREVEILQYIVQGYSNRQIANQLSLSARTVDSHRANLMGKLGIHDRVELVRYAMERRVSG